MSSWHNERNGNGESRSGKREESPMNRSIIALLALSCFATADAQSIGIGAGISAPNAEIAQLPREVLDDGWRAIEQRAEQGYHIDARIRFGGSFALVGGISYNRFLDAQSEYRDNSGRSVMLVSSQSVVPLSAGIAYQFNDGFIAPFASLEATLSYFYRGYETPRNGYAIPFAIESVGDARYGVAMGAGITLDLSLLRFDIAARLQFVNLFGDASTTEATMYYGQFGAIAYFGI